MSMIEPNNCWDGIVNGVNSEEFANILNILDFPMESLEGDGVAGDWEPHNFQSMGPIPLDALAGVPLVSQSQFAGGPEIKGSIRNAPVNIKSERIEPANCVGYNNNGSNTPRESFMSPKFRMYQTPSPVSILESGGSCSSVKCSITKPEIVIPRRVRSKRKRPSNLHSWFQTSPIICSGYVANRSANSGNNKDFNKQRLISSPNVSASLPEGFYTMRKKETTLGDESLSTKKCTHCQVSKTPQWREGPLGPKTLCNACGVRYRSGRLFPEYRPASSPTEANRSANSGDNKDFNKQRLTRSSNVSASLPELFYAMRKKETTLGDESLSTKKCTHCQVSKTPQWREGPLGPKTLCNACGVRYRSGRLFPEYRPASSPTFVPSFHSNSHRKVLEMRKNATQQDIEAEIPPMSPPPEFVPRSNYLFDPLS